MKYSPVATEFRIKYTPVSCTLLLRGIFYCPVVTPGEFLLQGNATVQTAHCTLAGWTIGKVLDTLEVTVDTQSLISVV